MGGSIVWKTREIGLPSYSKICTLWLHAYRTPLDMNQTGGGDEECKNEANIDRKKGDDSG
jgi:hypothetical protein